MILFSVFKMCNALFGVLLSIFNTLALSTLSYSLYHTIVISLYLKHVIKQSFFLCLSLKICLVSLKCAMLSLESVFLFSTHTSSHIRVIDHRLLSISHYRVTPPLPLTCYKTNQRYCTLSLSLSLFQCPKWIFQKSVFKLHEWRVCKIVTRFY